MGARDVARINVTHCGLAKYRIAGVLACNNNPAHEIALADRLGSFRGAALGVWQRNESRFWEVGERNFGLRSKR